MLFYWSYRKGLQISSRVLILRSKTDLMDFRNSKFLDLSIVDFQKEVYNCLGKRSLLGRLCCAMLSVWNNQGEFTLLLFPTGAFELLKWEIASQKSLKWVISERNVLL